jgi:general secretion pathway protein L
MYDQHLLRIGNDGKPSCLLSFGAQSQVQKKPVSGWSDVVLKDKSMVLLLPATWLYQSKTKIPSKNLDVLQKSIPFAIEEELSNEVEENYYAFNVNDDGSQDVIAIKKELLEGIGRSIKQNKLDISGIYSELDWIPAVEDAVSVWIEDDYALIRFGDGQVMRSAQAQVPQLIDMFKQNLKSVYTNDAEALQYEGLPVQNNLDEEQCRSFLNQHAVINLYLETIKEEKQQQRPESWRMIWVLAGALILSWLAIQMFQMMQLGKSIDGLKADQQALFKQVFADAAPSELIDPFAAMKSRMQLSGNHSTEVKSIFLDTVHHLGKVVKTMNSVELSNIRLVNDKLEIQIAAPNISAINSFHQQLQMAAKDYSVQIGVNELSDDNVYKSILTVVPR